jgi:hypothetical protein
MAFDARKIAGQLSSEPFEFTGMDGEPYELPNINTLTGAQGKRLKAGDETVIAELVEQDVIDAMDEMPVGVQAELSKAWVEHGGRSGKAASPSSAPRTRPRRSRST